MSNLRREAKPDPEVAPSPEREGRQFDLGLEALDRLIQDLGLAGPSLQRGERGFSWQGPSLRLEVRAEPLRASAGLEDTVRLSSRTLVLTEVPASRNLSTHLADLNRGTAMGAWSHDPESLELQLACSVPVRASDRHFWETWFLLALALQLAQAEAQLAALATELGGRPALAARTSQAGNPGVRNRSPDGTASDPLGAVRVEIIQAGHAATLPLEPSTLLDAALAETSRWILPMADSRGLSAILPFEGSMKVGDFFAQVEAGGENPNCARLRLDLAQPHPSLGAGLLCLLELPQTSSLPPASFDANRQNLAAARQGARLAQIGAWCDGERPSFVAFIPLLLLLAAEDQIEQGIGALLDVLADQIEQYLAT